MGFHFLLHHSFISVQFSCSVVYDSLQPHELQHASPPCPSPTPGVHSDSHPLNQWCHSLPQVNNMEGTQLHPSTENWIKDLLSMVLPIRTRQFPPQSVSPIRKLLLASYPSASEGRQTKPQSQKANQSVNMDQMPWSSFSECWALSHLFHSLPSLSPRGFSGHVIFYVQLW